MGSHGGGGGGANPLHPPPRSAPEEANQTWLTVSYTHFGLLAKTCQSADLNWEVILLLVFNLMIFKKC